MISRGKFLLCKQFYQPYSTKMLHFFFLSAIFFFFVLPVIFWCLRMLAALSLYFHPAVMAQRERENEMVRQAKKAEKEWDKEWRRAGKPDLSKPAISNPPVRIPQNVGPMSEQERAEALERGRQSLIKYAEAQEARLKYDCILPARRNE